MVLDGTCKLSIVRLKFLVGVLNSQEKNCCVNFREMANSCNYVCLVVELNYQSHLISAVYWVIWLLFVQFLTYFRNWSKHEKV